ncbi:MAG TPA: hypothetical protein VMR34_05545 [Candidatus Saccharimonadales bacterium]|nr:hypothetical protein [Candidatus Saccharimonadales bacterium]
MSNLQIHHLRTKPDVERNVVKLIALGYRYADVSVKTSVPMSTIKKIKKRNNPVLLQMKKAISKSDTDIVTRVHLKALRELEKRLDDPYLIETNSLVRIVKEMQSQKELISKQNALNPYNNDIYTPDQQKAIKLASDRNDEVALLKAVWPENN